MFNYDKKWTKANAFLVPQVTISGHLIFFFGSVGFVRFLSVPIYRVPVPVPGISAFVDFLEEPGTWYFCFQTQG
jgi:hypothetical protein